MRALTLGLQAFIGLGLFASGTAMAAFRAGDCCQTYQPQYAAACAVHGDVYAVPDGRAHRDGADLRDRDARSARYSATARSSAKDRSPFIARCRGAEGDAGIHCSRSGNAHTNGELHVNKPVYETQSQEYTVMVPSYETREATRTDISRLR